MELYIIQLLTTVIAPVGNFAVNSLYKLSHGFRIPVLSQIVTHRTCQLPLHKIKGTCILLLLRVLQSLMGHKSISSTEVYTKVFALDVAARHRVQFAMPEVDAVAMLKGNT